MRVAPIHRWTRALAVLMLLYSGPSSIKLACLVCSLPTSFFLAAGLVVLLCSFLVCGSRDFSGVGVMGVCASAAVAALEPQARDERPKHRTPLHKLSLVMHAAPVDD